MVVTDRRLLPARRGNRVRILGVLRGLRALGWRVELICLPDAGSDDELLSEVDAVHRLRARRFDGGDVACFDSRPFRWAVERVVAARRPEVVIAEYAWLAPTMHRLPPRVTRVVDCHDVLHERTDRFRAAGLDPWVSCTRVQEQGLLRSADTVLAAQYHDGAVLRTLVPDTDVRSVFPEISCSAPPSAPPVSSRVLAVGASHAGNDGILRFAASGWKAVLAAVPDARLDIAGTVAAGRPGPAVTFLGEVDDLAPSYEAAAVVVCPIEIGSGVKIKAIEALRYGKAMVATPAAVEGLPEAGRPAWVEARDLDGCASATYALLSRPDERARLEDRSAAFAEEHFAPVRIRRELDAALSARRSARRRLGLGASR
ncbi:Glycosyltransferase involved in cell wall bisynthesis [Geodermatophilus amargosae]|uniref:Glycosyltransferase involved in cell wall bisynthesis n=1 Tax=Geodermatophilus amargosae TaxID=1296565 RepID=A0A1I7CW15_9ACTN|nr:glycosyltransferase [Geodermatophilus amargosae]SFU03623.1 Glycosyltransferase involved in cell wall bisynthesis [Geodermatophilus amargosae]